MIRAYAAREKGGKLEPFDYDPGILADEDVEIAVEYCGICHSDLSMLDNDWGLTTYPFVPGHEVVGTIAALGAKVKELNLGQRVGLGWFSRSCSTCETCMSGDQNLCATAEGTIVGRHGGFAEMRYLYLSSKYLEYLVYLLQIYSHHSIVFLYTSQIVLAIHHK